MKKIALLLALVITLGTASVAFAAEVTTSGEVSYSLAVGDDLAFDSLDFKLGATAVVSDQIKAAIRLRPYTPDVPLTSDGRSVTNEVKFDQAYVTVSNFGLPLSATIGLNSVVNDPFSTDGFGFISGFRGFNIKTDSFNGVSGQLLLSDKDFKKPFTAAFVNYAPEFGTFGLVVRPAALVADKYDFAVNAKAAIPSTPVTALAEVVKQEGRDANTYMVGAEATLAGIDTYVYYFTAEDLDVSTLKYGASKEINGATYAVDFETADDTTTGTVGVTVAF